MRKFVDARNVLEGMAVVYGQGGQFIFVVAHRELRWLTGPSYAVDLYDDEKTRRISCDPECRILVEVPVEEVEREAMQWPERALKLAVNINQLLGKPRNPADIVAIVAELHELDVTYGPEVLEAWRSKQ